MNFARNRIRLLVVLATLIALALATGLSVSGVFRADIATERGLFGPVRLGVNGGMGGEGQATANPAPVPLPADPQPPLILTSGGSFPVTVTTAPYNGPTPEERALLHQLRDALKANYARQTAGLSPEERQMMPPPSLPDVRLPPRHLTPYEMQEIRNSINTLRGSQ